MKDEKQIQTIYIDQNDDSDDEINLREVFEKYTYYWKWFLFALILGLTVSYLYLRYTAPKYGVNSMILIDDKEKGGMTTELAAFKDLGILGDKKTTLDTEIGVLKSRTLIERVVEDLNFNITYFSKGKVRNSELYKSRMPYKINFFIADSVLDKLDTSFVIVPLDKSRFELQDLKNISYGNHAFGKNIKTAFGEINITPSSNTILPYEDKVIVKMSPVKKVAAYYKEKLKIEPENKKSSLLVLTINDPVKQKAKDFLNNLVFQYNEDAIAYKTKISENTDQFINDRIADISVDLAKVDKGVEDFKVKNKLTDLGMEAGIDMQSNSELQKRIVELNSQIKMVDYIMEHMNNNRDDLIPANLGLQDKETNSNTQMYNQLLLERNRIIKGSSKLNPTVINLDAQLKSLRASVEQGLRNLRSSLTFSLSEARNREYRINSKRKAVPQQEREFQDIKRKQQIIESLYLYLLQKREENAISLGIPVPKAKVIDAADGGDIPVSPKPLLVYLIGAVIGLFIPFMVISVRSLLDNLVHSYDDVEAVVKAPVIGDIPKTSSKKKVIIDEKENTNIAESFRLLRTNVNFMLSGAKDKAKTIFITSTLSGEGKTFIAINLASSLALLNKKVLLIGADIRKPKIANYLNIKNKKGLTHYLMDQNLNVNDIVYHDKQNKIDVIVSGDIPPNPSELLLNGRFDDVLAFGKQNYDYIIIDTSPVNMVTDTLLLGHHADLFIYVVRAEYLDKRMLKVPQMMYDNKRLPHMAMLINDTDYDNKGYGYGYGYGYGNHEKKAWYKRIF